MMKNKIRLQIVFTKSRPHKRKNKILPRKQKHKLNYLRYVITPKGISIRTKLTLNFMKRKMTEYEELKKELNKKDFKL